MTFEELSPRDKHIVELLALGFTTLEIADDLGVTTSAIKNCVHRLCNNVGAERRMRLVLHFYELHPRDAVRQRFLARKSQDGF